MRDVEKKIEMYEMTVIMYGDAMDKGDYDQACICLERNEKVFQRLQKYGKYASIALLQLLNHDNPYVRMYAATHLLGTYQSQSVRALEQLAREPGYLSFNARMVLEDYRKGTMVIRKFDGNL